jgi:nitrogen regulatory protein P-II 1
VLAAGLHYATAKSYYTKHTGQLLLKMIEAIIRPMRLEPVKAALAEEAGVTGLTISDVRGCGRQGGHRPGEFRGQQYVIALPPKVKIEMVVPDDDVDRVIDVIIAYARTGEEGDGKIFVLSMEEAIRVRTGDRGDIAVK